MFLILTSQLDMLLLCFEFSSEVKYFLLHVKLLALDLADVPSEVEQLVLHLLNTIIKNDVLLRDLFDSDLLSPGAEDDACV